MPVSTSAPDAAHPVALLNGTVVTPFRIAENQSIVLDGGAIAQMSHSAPVTIPGDAEVIDLEGMYVTPGFVDLHAHGAGGAGFNQAGRAEIDRILDHSIRHGTTRLLATLYLDEETRFLSALEQLVEYARQGGRQAVLHGVHLEGPFINPAMKGAMNAQYIWPATDANWERLARAGAGCIRMMTIAPEMPGAMEIMRAAARCGVVLAIAHSKARYEDIELANGNGLSQVTHMFNAMDPMHHRDPGIVTAALLKRELKLHLIADGAHVHPAVMQLLYRLKGAGGIILITDAISAAGQSDGVYDLAGQRVTVRGGQAFLGDGTLAGSTLSMEKGIETMVRRVGLPLQEAVRMATLNPARVLGLDRTKGVVAVGKDADLVVLDREFRVRLTVIGGRIVHRAAALP